MRESPSIIPWGDVDRTVYLVLDNFGGTFGGWAWPETDVADTDRATLIRQACADRDETPPSIADFIADHTRPSRVR